MNKVLLTGYLTKNASIKKVNDVTLLESSLAVSEVFHKEKQTCFIDIVMFGKVENLATFLQKGKHIAVSGKLHFNSWSDTNNKLHTKHNIIVDELEFLDKKQEKKLKEEVKQEQIKQKINNATTISLQDDIPF